MKSSEVRKNYIEFFKSKGHKEISSSSLIPENDPSTLFISAGMQPLVPYLLGEKHPAGKRLVNVQKCVRTGDIDEVGDKGHHTFLEMLGHWSLGDYFKKEAIGMTYDYLTKELKLDPDLLAFTVFAGDKNASRDVEAADVWKSLGVSEERIAFLPKEENWWEPVGSGGPCGPSTEMFFWSDKSIQPPSKFDPSDKRWVEFGNDVLMQYEKVSKGKYRTAKQKNIDNGTGLERLTALMNGLDDDYETDLFLPILKKIEELSDKKYKESNEITRSMRIIADHIRASTFIMSDGIVPSNLDQGYILRRLIRRSIRHGKMIGAGKSICSAIANVVIQNYKEIYPELSKNKKFIVGGLNQEENRFRKTLEQGLRQFKKFTDMGKVSGKEAFILFSTYGFPLEMTEELLEEKGKSVNNGEFQNEFMKHQEISRKGAKGKFKGGLADTGAKTTKLHTATHLLVQALRQILGDHVYQKGSNINPERLRFDFSHPEKVTLDQLKKVEDIVNNVIKKDLPVEVKEVTVDEAKKSGAMGVFEHKYGEKVKMYSIGDFSKEICGGPHVKHTSELGHFKIKKEQSSSAGVRRIKAVLE